MSAFAFTRRQTRRRRPRQTRRRRPRKPDPWITWLWSLVICCVAVMLKCMSLVQAHEVLILPICILSITALGALRQIRIHRVLWRRGVYFHPPGFIENMLMVVAFVTTVMVITLA